MAENQEIINELFAVRMNYEDELLNENDIIMEMKYHLRQRQNPPLSEDEMNQVINQFYTNYGIPISLEDIQAAQIPTPLNLNQIIQPLVSYENIMNLNSNGYPILPNNQIQNMLPNNQINDDDDDILENPIQNMLPVLNQGNNQHVQILNQMINLLNTNLNTPFNIHSTPLNINLPQMNDVVTTLEENELDKIKPFELEEDTEDICPITMTPLKKGVNVIKLPCNHIFEAEAIKEYLQKYNYKCPTCKKEVGKGHANLS